MAITPDPNNKMFQLAIQLVNQSSRNIFLTGKAGTGKTTFLKYIRENCPKQMAVTAPTGVAAINAGGVTIHSLFQLPLSPFIPGTKGMTNSGDTVDTHGLISRLRMNSEKKKVLQELELLIIDEISMVRCDTMDAVDTILRHTRNRHREAFGGVQVLFIGDMFQLPPVIKEPEWSMLADYYDSPYFFDSHVIKENCPLYIEFNKIYRQSEEQFIRLLNQVRNNELDPDGMEILEGRFEPAFRRRKEDGYIILTTHNETARQINAVQLQELDSRLHVFNAEIEDDFPPHVYPADESLQLKTGAQVMFIKNDMDKNKRYFNGKIGTVVKIEEDKIFVQCKDDPEEIEVKKDKWENIRYSVDKSTRAVEEKLLGSFSQYPLRLAWAITIHKSQGLTFEKAIIDAGKSFTAGQVYVALSRCTKLEGIVLQSRINASSLQTDPRIVAFSKSIVSPLELENELELAKKEYIHKILLSLFDFSREVADCREVYSYAKEHEGSFNAGAADWVKQVLDRTINQFDTALKFQNQLQRIFTEKNSVFLLERLKAASLHFIREVGALIQTIQESPVVTDSRMHAKEYNELLKDILTNLSLKTYMLESCSRPVDIDSWHRRRNGFKAPSLLPNAYAGASQRPVTEVPHPLLHQQLRKLRDSICDRKGIPLYLVAGTITLNEMATYLPQTLEELGKISGFGPSRIGSYGQQFLDIIIHYSQQNNLSSLITEKPGKKKPSKKADPEKKETRVDTKNETYRLYKQGLKMAEIAKQRNLSLQTIEGHLAHYVRKGEIPIEDLVSREKLLVIGPALNEFEGGSIIPVREKLGKDIGFGEIRLVIAWTDFQKQHINGAS